MEKRVDYIFKFADGTFLGTANSGSYIKTGKYSADGVETLKDAVSFKKQIVADNVYYNNGAIKICKRTIEVEEVE